MCSKLGNCLLTCATQFPFIANLYFAVNAEKPLIAGFYELSKHILGSYCSWSFDCTVPQRWKALEIDSKKLLQRAIIQLATQSANERLVRWIKSGAIFYYFPDLSFCRCRIPAYISSRA